jgi:predicted CopG family antitoxin
MLGRTREDTTIVLKRETWKQLAMLKITLGMRTYDEVIRYLLNNRKETG